jgi:hypothetical protein
LSTDERKRLAGLPPTFDSITADQACNEKLYEELAFYRRLANQYKCGAGKNKGEHLKVGPVVVSPAKLAPPAYFLRRPGTL